MRLGGPILETCLNPDQWIAALQRLGYSAAYWPFPIGSNQSNEVVQAYAEAAEVADVVIAEVGAWSNPLSPDEKTRHAALELCKKQLAFADTIGARCCVNIAGSRGRQWDGPHADNLTDDTFDLIVETVRKIIDAVKPTRTFYTLEPMPWMYPDSVDSYLQLIRTIDRQQFAVHLDPVNWIYSPQSFYNNASIIRESFQKLSPFIKSCHAKDVGLGGKLTVHLDEVVPGLGGFDYRTYLQELNNLDPDTPLMLEHFSTAKEYLLGAEYIRSMARDLGISIR